MSIRTQRSSARFGAATIVAALIASLFAFIAPAGALAPTDPVVRYAGANRYDTAAQAAIGNFAAGANPNIVIASGENFPDGLAAAYLAGAINGPLLLTAQASLPAATANALGTLAAATTTVHVIGGTAAVSANVRAQLTALGYTVNEISGASRYETASAVAAAANTIAGVGSFQGQRTAIVTTGENFPDALSAGPLAFAGRHPVLLTTGAALSASADASLTALNIQRVVILGGTAAVSQSVQDAIAAKGIAVQRVSGPNRSATAAALAALLVSTAVDGGAGWTGSFAPVLALGTNFPDALAAAQVGGRNLSPIVLTASLPAESQAFLAAHATRIDGLFVMGGTSAISAETLTAARTAATPVAVTATITALHGAGDFTIEFSEPITAGTVAAGDFTFASVGRTIVADTVATLPTPGLTVATSFRVTIDTAVAPVDAFKPGDVVNLVANTVTAVSGRTNAAATVTVAADTTRPTALLVRGFNGHNQVWVAFSEPVNATPGAVTAGAVASAATTPLPSAPARLFLVTLAANATHGDQIRIAEGQFTDLAGNTNQLITGTVTTDILAPSLLSASYTVAPLTPADIVVDSGDGGEVEIVALQTGVAAGVAGNAWDVIAGNASGTTSVTVNTSLRQIALNGPLATLDANALVVAMNSNPTFAANFRATVASGGPIDAGNLVDTDLANGTSRVVVRGQFSESINPVGPVFNQTNIVGAQAGGTVGTLDAMTGVLTYTYTATATGQLPTVVNMVAGNVVDLAGNANANQASVAVTVG